MALLYILVPLGQLVKVLVRLLVLSVAATAPITALVLGSSLIIFDGAAVAARGLPLADVLLPDSLPSLVLGQRGYLGRQLGGVHLA